MPSSPPNVQGNPDAVDPPARPGPRPPGVRNALLARMNPSDRSYWQLVPRKNFRLAILLLLLIVGVIAVKRSGVLSFGRLFDQIAPAAPAAGPAPASAFQHLEFRPAPPKRP